MDHILDSPSTLENANVNYAGFWLRFIAAIIDGIVLAIPSGLISSLFAINLTGFTNPENPDVSGFFGALFPLIGINILISLLYYGLMESSSNQATLGKMALGLKVIDVDGNRITFGKSLVRNLCKYISTVILYIGYIIAAFTAKKQALHDIIAGTLIVKK